MELTALLQRLDAGEAGALNDVLPLVYHELKKIAQAYVSREGPVRLEATALVHEAYMRMAASSHPRYENRAHFYGIAAQMMRHILVDAARYWAAQKRSASSTVCLTGLSELPAQSEESFLALNQALDRLAAKYPRKAKIIEMRYFGGLTAEETASVTGLSVPTIQRELRFAQAWLHRELAS